MNKEDNELKDVITDVFNNSLGCELCMKSYLFFNNIKDIISKEDIIKSECPVMKYVTKYALLKEDLEGFVTIKYLNKKRKSNE